MNHHRSSRGETLPVVAVALGAIAIVLASAAILSNRPDEPPTASPSVPAIRSPAPSPSSPVSAPPASPSPVIPRSPSPSPSPSAPSSIDLDSASRHDVTLDLVDQTGWVRDVVSGHPGDGMSVRWHASIVEQAGPNAVRVTWVAFPNDERITLGVNSVDGPLAFVIVQRGPYPNTDALGENRVVVVTFDRPVDADELDVQILDETIDP